MKSILINTLGILSLCPFFVSFFLTMASQIDYEETLDFIDDDFQNDDFNVSVV